MIPEAPETACHHSEYHQPPSGSLIPRDCVQSRRHRFERTAGSTGFSPKRERNNWRGSRDLGDAYTRAKTPAGRPLTDVSGTRACWCLSKLQAKRVALGWWWGCPRSAPIPSRIRSRLGGGQNRPRVGVPLRQQCGR